MSHLSSFSSHKGIWIAFVLAAVVFASLCVSIVLWQGAFFDGPVYQAVAGFISPGMARFVAWFTDWGDVPVLVPLTLVLIVILRQRGRSALGAAIAVNLGGAALLNYLIKQIFQRPRPEILRLIEVSGHSFPSGHSFTSMAFYGFLIYLVFRLCRTPWRWAVCAGLAVLILAIGLSRIYLGVHYPSDVAAGFCGGFLWLVIYTCIPAVRRAIYSTNVESNGDAL